MTKLNLTANGTDQEILLAHLTPIVSDVLAEKINNGVKITKDGKELINKKDLDTFMEYLIDKIDKMKIAKKYKRANVAGMEGTDILNHAIHYFEEDNIEGKLFNVDGTEYKQPKPEKKYSAVSVIPAASAPAAKPKPQLSIFDLVSDGAESANIVTQPKPKTKQGSPMYLHYLSIKEKYKDAIVFYRLGDFYEMFNGDAVTTANELDLTLTGRDCGLAERVPMTGVPFHAADAYIEKLVSRGYKVVVAEPLDGKTERTVERVIAPQPAELNTNADEDPDDDLTVAEMQKFDGDIDEPDEVPTISKILEGVDLTDDQDAPDDDFDLEKEREWLKAFDKNAIIILSDLLGNIFTLE